MSSESSRPSTSITSSDCCRFRFWCTSMSPLSEESLSIATAQSRDISRKIQKIISETVERKVLIPRKRYVRRILYLMCCRCVDSTPAPDFNMHMRSRDASKMHMHSHDASNRKQLACLKQASCFRYICRSRTAGKTTVA